MGDLTAHAGKRKMQSNSIDQPDVTSATASARILCKDYVSGKLLFAHRCAFRFCLSARVPLMIFHGLH